MNVPHISLKPLIQHFLLVDPVCWPLSLQQLRLSQLPALPKHYAASCFMQDITRVMSLPKEFVSTLGAIALHRPLLW